MTSNAMQKATALMTSKREAIADREKTLKNLQWTGKLTREEKLVLYHATRAYGLDPALREIHILGGNIYPTVAAMVRIAERSGDYMGCSYEELEPLEEGERRYKCTIKKWVHGQACSFEGIGRASQKTTNRLVGEKFVDELAQTRAKGRALRTAWSISLPAFEEVDTAGMETSVVTPELLQEVTEELEPPKKRGRPARQEKQPQGPAVSPDGEVFEQPEPEQPDLMDYEREPGEEG